MQNPYDHYIIDNGSKDETVEWLETNEKKFKKVIYNSKNMGISIGTNQALGEILKYDYDLVIKMDNDCEVVSDNILRHIAEIYQNIKDQNYVLSPRVEGIGHQPIRIKHITLVGREIGVTHIIGGLFRIVPLKMITKYREPENFPIARGQDSYFCKWLYNNKITMGYIEELIVNHFETTHGQGKRYPEYYKRKLQEMNNSISN